MKYPQFANFGTWLTIVSSAEEQIVYKHCFSGN